MERFSGETLAAHKILASLSAADRRAVSSCVAFDEIDSTNSYLLENSGARTASGMFEVCCAETQRRGRGRMGRRWDSPHGGIYLSVLSDCDDTVPTWLGVAAAFEVAAALEEHGVPTVGVKWPNDIYCADAKLGGILVEKKRGKCVVGLGLNDRKAEMAQTADYSYTCLEQLGVHLERSRLVGILIKALMRAFARFRQIDKRALMARYTRFDCLKGKAVRVFLNDGTVSEGIGVGIAENAGFCIEHSTGRCIYQAGEVKIKQ